MLPLSQPTLLTTVPRLNLLAVGFKDSRVWLIPYGVGDENAQSLEKYQQIQFGNASGSGAVTSLHIMGETFAVVGCADGAVMTVNICSEGLKAFKEARKVAGLAIDSVQEKFAAKWGSFYT